MGNIYEIHDACAGCGSAFSGRVTDAALEKWGMRKVDGKWYCNFCTGAGYGGMYRRDPDEAAPQGQEESK